MKDMENIIKHTSDEFGITVAEMKGASRKAHIVEARAAFSIVAIAHRFPKLHIAHFLGKDHTSVHNYGRLYHDTKCLDHIKPKVESIKSKIDGEAH